MAALATSVLRIAPSGNPGLDVDSCPGTISADAGDAPTTAPAWLRALEVSSVHLTLRPEVMGARPERA
jgi:hypothetical protein